MIRKSTRRRRKGKKHPVGNSLILSNELSSPRASKQQLELPLEKKLLVRPGLQAPRHHADAHNSPSRRREGGRKEDEEAITMMDQRHVFAIIVSSKAQSKGCGMYMEGWPV